MYILEHLLRSLFSISFVMSLILNYFPYEPTTGFNIFIGESEPNIQASESKRHPPDCIILDKFLLADEPFGKAL